MRLTLASGRLVGVMFRSSAPASRLAKPNISIKSILRRKIFMAHL
jgi:hypothetical protein